MALIQCPECAESISSKAKSCPHCGVVMKVPLMKREFNAGGCCVVVLVVALTSWFLYANRTGAPSSGPPARSTIPQIGDKAFLRSSSGKPMVVAASEDAYDKYKSAALANDGTGIDQLEHAGLISTVPNGTRVLVLAEFSFSMQRVRVLDGALVDRAVWTSRDWVTVD